MRGLRYLSLAALLAFSACDTSMPTDMSYPVVLDRGVEIPYMVSEGHFVNNPFEAITYPTCLVIREYECFEAVFSIAWVQGLDESKLITEEGMEKGFVLSIIYKGYDSVSLGIEKVVLHNGELIVLFTKELRMSGTSFTGNYHLTLLIDDCDFDSVALFENGRRKEHVQAIDVYCH